MGVRRILFEIYSLENAGAQHVVMDLALELKKMGKEIGVVVLSPKPNNSISKMLDDNGIYCIYSDFSNVWWMKKLKQFKALNHAIKEFRPDIVHGHTEYFCLWVYSLIHRLKFVETFHSQAYRLNTLTVKKLYKILNQKKLITPVILSETNALEYSKIFGLDLMDINIIPNPIDVGRFTHKTERNVGKNITFGLAARFNMIKRHDLLIEAFSDLVSKGYDCRLMLAGEGETLPAIRKKVKELGLEDKVFFEGEVEDISFFLAKLDIGIMCSDSECYPLFILECMAKGLPIISTRVGGIVDMVKDNGIIVEKNNVHQLSEAMEKLVNSLELRNQMGEKGRLYALNHDVSIVADKYLNLYEKVVSE